MKKTLRGISLDFMCFITMIVCTGTIMGIFDEAIYCFEKWTFVTMLILIATFLCSFCLYKTSIKIKICFKKANKIMRKNIKPKMYKDLFKISIFLSFVVIIIEANKYMKSVTVIKDVTIINLLIGSSINLIVGIIAFYCFLCIFAYALNVSYQLCKIIKIKAFKL